eukprot:CAMPEP_0170557812 /NCGR_PEP_ID=MMETSP0211-20121228/30360_1 /TAXON_ID=311385 /ORGANISM="Pseudokeronopsis sp., Strain OXSARD2" /LENGTH=60 /DNA_ID=CAMNT_0010869183 /DNA_START=145 /DNA_END=324 /DNA_ORIENTATION=-
MTKGVIRDAAVVPLQNMVIVGRIFHDDTSDAQIDQREESIEQQAPQLYDKYLYLSDSKVR